MKELKRPRGRPKKEPTVSQHYRLPVRLIVLATKKAKALSLQLPGYIASLILRDCVEE